QSDEEKTSTDQDEDIKVSTYNSDEETTSSEDETIDIPEPMDTEPTDPYKKESDIQINDYLINFDQNTISNLTSKIENLIIDKLKSENSKRLNSK
ncbi:hypothetical protein Goshw_015538, partial [Gossypium schwendimanii]|nr:hypothetical protein [Gossypium schwendimanii]